MWYAIGVVVAFVLALMLANSFRLLKPDEAAEIYLFGSHICTQFPSDFRESLKPDQQKTFDSIDKKRIWALDIVFGLYPFYQIIKFSTSGSKAQYHDARIFTKGTEKFAKVRLHGDPSATSRFFTIRRVIRGIGLPSVSNLEQMCEIGKKDSHVHYRDTVLASLFRDQVQDVFVEGVRQAASAFFWSNNAAVLGIEDNSEREISTSKDLWEKLTLYILAAPESFFAQACLLKRPERVEEAWKVKTPEEFLAFLDKEVEKRDFYDLVISVDINITGLDLAAESPDDSEAQRAVNLQFIREQEARGSRSLGFANAEITERQGKAEAARITAVGEAQLGVAKQMAALPGVDANAVILGQMVGEKVQNLNVTGIGASLTETVTQALKGKTT